MLTLSVAQNNVLRLLSEGTGIAMVKKRYQIIWRPNHDAALYPEMFPKMVSVHALLRKDLVYKTGHPVYGEIFLISAEGRKHVRN